MQTHEYVSIEYKKKVPFTTEVIPKLKDGWRIIQIGPNFILMERPTNSTPCVHCGRR